MKRCSILGFGLACFGAFGVSIVSAQDLGGALKGAAGGGLDPSSLASGSAGNAAGIIEFCVKNNYLGGDAASSVKNALVGKMGGEDQAKADPGYADGAKGILTGSDGTSTNLGDLAGGAGGLGDMKGKLTEKACGAVLDHAKSLL
jgi:hypothetical protein